MRFPSLFALLVWTIAASTAVPTWAQREPSEPDITIEDELLVEDEAARAFSPKAATTATKGPADRVRTPLSLSSVSSAQLHEQEARILGDALENVAGVTAHRNGGTQDLFYIRGFESLSSSAVLTDGALEPESSFYQMYNVDRVEVLRGPAGFLYGSSPLAGTINLVRKQPTSGRQGRGSLLFGSHDTVRGTLDLNLGDADGANGLRLLAMFDDTAGWRDDKDSQVVAVNPSFRRQVGTGTTMILNAEYDTADLASDSGIPLLGGAIADVPRTRSYQSPFDFGDRDIVRLRADFETLVSDRFILRNKTYYTELDQASAGTIVAGAFVIGPFEPQVARVLAGLEDRQTFYGHQIDALLRFDTDAARHDLVLGLEVQRQDNDFDLGFSFLPFIGLENPVETAAQPLFPVPGLGSRGDTETTVIAPYLLDTIALGDHWVVSLGGRYDSIEFEDAISGVERDDDHFSPFVGILYAPNARWSLYANVAESFHPPSTTVAASVQEPEEGKQVEVGIKARLFGGAVDAALGAYQLDKEKIAIADAFGFPTQSGDQRSEGVELELAGRHRGGVRWTFAYAWTDSELTRFTEAVVDPSTGQLFVLDFSGNQPAWVPEQTARLWASKPLRGGLTVAGGLRWVGERFVDEDNAVELDGYVTLDASLAYSRGGRWTARLRLANLTDEDYEIRGLGAQSVLPADGFNVLGGVQIDF